MADDFGYNDVSWNNPEMITPELETLARGGVVLDTFYSQPRCSPSRASRGGPTTKPPRSRGDVIAAPVRGRGQDQGEGEQYGKETTHP